MSEVENKIKFIITWYNVERIKFSFPKQIMLAKTWIEICTKSEEYEMAAALQKEKEEVIKNFLDYKKASRTWKEKAWYYILLLKRKLKQ